jgi:thymidylate synthase (FAD)
MDYVSGHNGDARLLRHLYTSKHMTPFEMAGLTLEVQAPIFVFREWHRHHTQGYSEFSARYAEMPPMFYVPTLERMMSSAQDNINKQGSKDGFQIDSAQSWIEEIEDHYETTYELYKSMLDAGIAREVACIVLPVGMMSRMRATANLRNWMGFLKLRLAPDAQWEIRQCAIDVAEIIKVQFPRTFALFNEAP